MDTRLDSLRAWLQALPPGLGLRPDSIRPASNDASFRRYFRIDADPAHGGTLVAMDAPPPMEDVRPFVHAAEVLARSGVAVPRVVESDVPRGFLLLEDFGSVTYLSVLDAASASALYADASRALVAIQTAGRPDDFPPYDRALLLRELQLYPDWYVAKHKGVTLTDDERSTLATAFDAILANVLAQPRVTVHRDYHSRNLMLLPGDRNPGILDFQDAVVGSYTYDLVSLLRDAYVSWDEEQVLDHAIRHWERARKAGLPVPAEFGDFYRDFEWMGLQRHLKVLGIFARLCHRDGKDRYLADMPLVLRYVRDAARRYTALAPLARLVDRIEGDAPGVGYTF
ncbi:MAG: phosphotransferase [Burkholderiales bacterium]|jgi:aminoglycoside/choline kinase family phosphotransferase